MKYIVSHVDWYNHDLTMEIVHAENLHEAVKKHSKITDMVFDSQDIKTMKQEAYNCDFMFDVMALDESEAFQAGFQTALRERQ